MLDSAEHEIYPAYKPQTTNNLNVLLAEHEHFIASKYETAI